jgi:hypothetical protein
MKPIYFVLAAVGAMLSGCGTPSGQPSRSVQAVESKFIHSPPIQQLTPQQLRSLSMDCQKYSPDKSSRGPYDTAYCEDAIAAWSDSPLELVIVKPPDIKAN